MATASPLDVLNQAYGYLFDLAGNLYSPRIVRGEEGLSRTFRFELQFRAEDSSSLHPRNLSGYSGSLNIERNGVLLRRLFGIFTEARLSASGRGARELRATFEPRMALLAHRSNCRVFRDKTVPEIVGIIFKDAEIGTELRLKDTYKRRPYTVQYNETDLAFVHRLLEDEGIFYAFPNHIAPPEDAVQCHAVILGDGPNAYEPIEGGDTLPLRRVGGLDRPEEHITTFRRAASMGPGKVTVRDWNLERPSDDMDASARGPTQGSAEFYSYPGKFETPSEGQRVAKLMADAFAAQATRYSGETDAARLSPSHTFKLVSDGDAFGATVEGEYVVTSITHDFAKAADPDGAGNGSPRSRASFNALPAKMTFRPKRVTPQPIIASPISGFVTGPSGEDIHTDAYGRVKVRFPWDRHQPVDDTASHWVPVLQENTGSSSAIPRVGWEVLVGFVDGNPDRPYVLGRLYNGTSPFPEALPAGKTKSALRSLSSPGRDGQNEIWMEDKAGQEMMSTKAQKDQNVVVANDKKEDVLDTEDNKVVMNETILVGANNTVTVAKAQILAVDGNQTISVTGSRKRKVGTAEQVTVKGSRAMSIGSLHFRRIGGLDKLDVKSSLSETIGGVDVEVSLKKNSTNAALVQTLTVGGAVVEIAGKGKSESTEMLRVETIGMRVLTKVATKFSLKTADRRKTTAGILKVDMKETILFKIGKLFDGSAIDVDSQAKTGIVIRSGGSEIIINAAGISMKSDKKITIEGTSSSDLDAAKVTYQA